MLPKRATRSLFDVLYAITEFKFEKLDHSLLNPIGVYGSKQEIVKFFHHMRTAAVKMCVYPLTHRSTLTINSLGVGIVRSAT